MESKCNPIESAKKSCAINLDDFSFISRQNTDYDENEGASFVISNSDIADDVIRNEAKNEDYDAVEKWLKIKHDEDKHQWRKIYLGRSFYLVSYVLYISLSFLLFSSVGLFTISENVLIALLTTMVFNVLGVLAIAFHWLYQK